MAQEDQNPAQQGKSIEQDRRSAKRKGQYGEVFFNWNFSEFGTAWRNRSWQKAGIIIGALLLVYAVFSANYLFAVIIVLSAIIFYFQAIQKPLTVNCQITEDGIKIGKRLYDYRELDKFWIIYEPPNIKNLYLEFRNPVKPRLGIPLQNQDPIKIRQTLLNYLIEDTEREHEPLSDGLARWFRLHH